MIKFTEKAIEEIAKANPGEGYNLRLGVAGGGCSGFTYQMGFEEIGDFDPLNDMKLELGTINAVIDRKSDAILEETVVDYHDSLMKKGFVFENAKAVKGCGCGQSFGM